MSNILFEFNVEAAPEAVYQAVTDASGLKSWWTPEVMLEPKEGGKAEFGFSGMGSFVFEIAQMKQNERVVWDTVQAMPDWGSTQVTFDIEPADGGAKVLFGHRNFQTEDGSFAAVSYNWAYFMFSLKSYLETGKGTPYGA